MLYYAILLYLVAKESTRPGYSRGLWVLVSVSKKEDRKEEEKRVIDLSRGVCNRVLKVHYGECERVEGLFALLAYMI